jgi:hypothetical protein
MSDTEKASPKPQQTMWANIVFNIAIPTMILIKGADWFSLPAWTVLVLALAFPVLYFLHDLNKRGRRNIISIIGFSSLLITGGVGLLHLPPEWIAIKEAAVPSLFAVAILVTSGTRNPLVSAFLLNPDIFDVARIENAVAERGTKEAFARVMRVGTLIIALSFLLSAVLNFMLARLIVHSPGGTPEFNAEIGRMQLLSYPVIALPSTLVGMLALWYLLRGIKRLTGLSFDDISFDEAKAAPEATPAAQADASPEAAPASTETQDK